MLSVRQLGADALTKLIDCDGVLWTDIAAAGYQARALGGPELTVDAALGAELARTGLEHPAVRSYLTPGDTGAPRRVSDVVSQREWEGSGLYSDAFRMRSSRYQLSVVAGLDADGGHGWVLEREHRDFSDRDVEVASAVLPLLARLFRAAPAVEAPAPVDVGMTSRERQVLALLDTGRTAAAIARACGITESTVRKHLEQIYRKFGTHDRLTAVQKARGLGLV